MTLLERCKKVEGLVLDVDGILSKGEIFYHADGMEMKQFHVRDGSGIKMWTGAGKKVAFISGRNSGATSVRGKELGAVPILQGNPDKRGNWASVLQQWNLDAAQVACMGDDAVDEVLLKAAGLAVSVADAHPKALRNAHYVTRNPGGMGAVRELIELILAAQGTNTITA